MTKPEGIPSEVWTAAENALDLLLCNCRESSGSTEQLRTDSIEPIARAILAERERAAALSVNAAEQWENYNEFERASEFRELAAAIRSPHNPKDAQ